MTKNSKIENKTEKIRYLKDIIKKQKKELDKLQKYVIELENKLSDKGIKKVPKKDETLDEVRQRIVDEFKKRRIGTKKMVNTTP